jgi:putative transposase
MNEELIRRLPEAVFSKAAQVDDHPVEDNAFIDMETLIHLVSKWVVDVYNITVHPGIGARPLDRWQESGDR